MIQTGLEQQRADQNAQTQVQSIDPINVGSPTIDLGKWQGIIDQYQNYSKGIPKLDPPSESDIRDDMWFGSLIIGALAGLATGNIAAGLTGGLWAGIAIHDEGYARRDRSQYAAQLYSQGISAPAIMQWYETGDTKILEQEKDRIQREADHKDELEQRGLDREQQKTFHNDQMEQQRLSREQQAEIANQAHLDRLDSRNAMNDNANRADRRADLSEERLANSEATKAIDPEKQKLFYLKLANSDLTNLEQAKSAGDKDAAAMAYTDYRDNMARAKLGGGATLDESQIASATGLPSVLDDKINSMKVMAQGLPSEHWLAANRIGMNNAIKNSHAAIRAYGNGLYNSYIQKGDTPDQAMKKTAGVMSGTGVGNQDWSKAPEASDNGDHAPAAGTQHTAANGVTFTVKATK